MLLMTSTLEVSIAVVKLVTSVESDTVAVNEIVSVSCTKEMT